MRYINRNLSRVIARVFTIIRKPAHESGNLRPWDDSRFIIEMHVNLILCNEQLMLLSLAEYLTVKGMDKNHVGKKSTS